jgi:hypothetical protein
MKKQYNLEKLINCEYDKKTQLPRHIAYIPINNQIKDLPKYYCYDSRRDHCYYSIIIDNKTYCSYTKN